MKDFLIRINTKEPQHGDELQGESNSISNQKAMLEVDADKNGFTGIRHYTYDGI